MHRSGTGKKGSHSLIYRFSIRMAKITEFLDPKDLSRLAHHQVLARRVVEGFCSGLHRSPPVCVEFKQHRAYTPGDEIRRIDWKVFAKTDRFYVREYEEETNLRCHLLLDASGSMSYGGEDENRINKLLWFKAYCVSCNLCLRQTDSVGLTLTLQSSRSSSARRTSMQIIDLRHNGRR